MCTSSLRFKPGRVVEHAGVILVPRSPHPQASSALRRPRLELAEGQILCFGTSSTHVTLAASVPVTGDFVVVRNSCSDTWLMN